MQFVLAGKTPQAPAETPGLEVLPEAVVRAEAIRQARRRLISRAAAAKCPD
jgi:hypothetical protein